MQLSELPTVIDGPGVYKTRSGLKAVIHEIKGPGTFSAKGNWFKADIKRRNYPGEFNIWHVSGRFMPLAEHSLDIIEKVDLDSL